MAGKSDYLENALLKLIFWGTAIANIADNAAASPLTNLYLALHTADPTDAGSQNSSECTYTGYARLTLARTSGAWSISGNTVTPLAAIVFETCSAGSETATHCSIGTASSGAGNLLYVGSISPSIAIANGVAPTLTTASSITED